MFIKYPKLNNQISKFAIFCFAFFVFSIFNIKTVNAAAVPVKFNNNLSGPFMVYAPSGLYEIKSKESVSIDIAPGDIINYVGNSTEDITKRILLSMAYGVRKPGVPTTYNFSPGVAGTSDDANFGFMKITSTNGGLINEVDINGFPVTVKNETSSDIKINLNKVATTDMSQVLKSGETTGFVSGLTGAMMLTPGVYSIIGNNSNNLPIFNLSSGGIVASYIGNPAVSPLVSDYVVFSSSTGIGAIDTVTIKGYDLNIVNKIAAVLNIKLFNSTLAVSDGESKNIFLTPGTGAYLGDITGAKISFIIKDNTFSSVTHPASFFILGKNTNTISLTKALSGAPALVATPMSATEVGLSWTATAGAVSYKIEWESPKNAGFNATNVINIPSANTVTYVHSNLKVGTEYNYRITATMNDGTSFTSVNSTAKTLSKKAPTTCSTVNTEIINTKSKWKKMLLSLKSEICGRSKVKR